MKTGSSFSDILTAAAKSWCRRNADEGILSLALPVKGVDPLQQITLLKDKQPFRFLWDEAPGLSLAASGICQQLNLAGNRRFELAQRFSDITLRRVIDGSPEVPAQARPRILLAFSFFDDTTERLRNLPSTPSVQAILPRWQLSKHGKESWLRLNAVASHEAEARELAEKLWLMVASLSSSIETEVTNNRIELPNHIHTNHWQKFYKPALSKGIDLVNHGKLEKLVLAVRQTIQLEKSLNPLDLLSKLRFQQAGSCRFLWQKTQDEAFFGASPERLISLHKGRLCSDALAGTTSHNEQYKNLLHSAKDMREHEMVVHSITNQLKEKGLKPKRTRKPQLAKHGQLVHLHTPITADASGYLALQLAEALHPTPAVAGVPRKEAISWLRTLEPFERGNYAAPIGWIDNHGDAELRVAIRCGHTNGKSLELTAGAGLVKGSIAENELEEVNLKLGVLANQLAIKRTTSQGVS